MFSTAFHVASWLQIQINGFPDILQCLLAGLALRPTAFQRWAFRIERPVAQRLSGDVVLSRFGTLYCACGAGPTTCCGRKKLGFPAEKYSLGQPMSKWMAHTGRES
jgi:hypothetical protein